MAKCPHCGDPIRGRAGLYAKAGYCRVCKAFVPCEVDHERR